MLGGGGGDGQAGRGKDGHEFVGGGGGEQDCLVKHCWLLVETRLLGEGMGLRGGNPVD